MTKMSHTALFTLWGSYSYSRPCSVIKQCVIQKLLTFHSHVSLIGLLLKLMQNRAFTFLKVVMYMDRE